MESTYANVNGLRMYYEIHGQGPNLVLIHGGGSSIETTFSRILPHLAQRYRVLVMDLQGHGRTRARKQFSGNTIPEDAEDVWSLMQQVGFDRSHVLGFSKGGASALYLAARHPEVIDRLVVSAIFCRKEGAISRFWDGFENASLDMMPQALKDAYLAINNNPADLQTMFELDCKSMVAFEDWNEKDLKKIEAKTLVLTSFQDIVTPEHALQMARSFPDAELVILRGSHGEFVGDMSVRSKESRMPEVAAEIVHEFLSN